MKRCIAFLVFALGGCLDNSVTTCADGTLCAPDQVCAPTGGCADQAQIDACVDVAEGEPCNLAGIGAGLCRDQLCVVAGCGDGIVDVGELCDDGNETPDDACTNDCTLPTCGDGVMQSGEECDEGAANADDRACTTRCMAATCGDGFIHAPIEECDAAAANADDDACTTACLRNVCGDGKTWAGVEPCDDGNLVGGDGCDEECRKIEMCGDSFVDTGEDCDDGNLNAADGCDACDATEWLASAVGDDDAAGTSALLSGPMALVVDAFGNVFFADTGNHRIRRLDAETGVITTVAGNGERGDAGDGGLATGAQLYQPNGVAVDGLGNVFIADTFNNRVRRVDAATGIITAFAGTGQSGTAGDGGPATSAELSLPLAVAVDGLGNVFIADTDWYRIRRVDAATGIIDAYAGNGNPGGTGDDGLAIDATFDYPTALAVNGDGDLFIADADAGSVRRVDAITTIITEVVGAAQLASPFGVAVDRDGNVFVTDEDNGTVLRVDGESDAVTTFAGTGVHGFSGDGGVATSAQLDSPWGVAVDQDGNVSISDFKSQRIRRVDAGGLITTIAGTGVGGYWPDGGSARSAPLDDPQGGAFDASGNLYFAEAENQRIRKVDLVTGTITTVAGNGTTGFSGDGGPALQAQLNDPYAVDVDELGNLYIAEVNNGRIRKVDASTGVISTLALVSAVDLAYAGGFVYAVGGHRVRRVDASTGAITAYAGTGTSGFDGDGNAATEALLATPQGAAFDAAGNLFIADTNNRRVRRVDAVTKNISTYAGNGTQGYAGEGVLATNAELFAPSRVAVDADGNLFIGDGVRVRRVDATTKLITTVAGSGTTPGEAGDGADARDALLGTVGGLAVDAAGNVYVADESFDRIRRVDATTQVITTAIGRVGSEGEGPLAQARLGDPRALALGTDFTLFASGVNGTLQALRTDWVETVAGRYPQTVATDDLARFRDETFGDVGGVAFDEANGLVYLTETSADLVHVVTIVDPDDEDTWTIAALPVTGLHEPTGLLLDGATLYVADTGNHAIRAIDLGDYSVTTFAGRPRVLGFFGDGGAADDALLYQPQAMAKCPDGDVFVADTGNHRVRRIDSSGQITTVLGVGVAASSGQGVPATAFPVDEPRGLACDAFGNVYVTSSTTVRMLPASDTHVVDGAGEVQTIYGAPPRDEFPAAATACLAGIVVVDDSTLWVTDACTGILVELSRASQ